ncbi:hypothetical protein GCK32_006779, partial [Trichostrongylus colubriformis]
GQWDRLTFSPAKRGYSFPSCGITMSPVQSINGTLGQYGDCFMILQSLRDWLLNDLWSYCSDQNCTGQLWIDSNCPSSAGIRTARNIQEALYHFRFFANVK